MNGIIRGVLYNIIMLILYSKLKKETAIERLSLVSIVISFDKVLRSDL